jgi:hypothetical protein
MSRMAARGRAALVATLVVWGAVAAAGGALVLAAQGTTLEPLVVGWERIFKLSWEVAERAGQPVVRGYLTNDSPYTVTRIQLLVEALDRTGRVAGQRVGWFGPTLTPFSRGYFELPAPPGETWRVRVFAFDRVEAPSRDH